MADIHPVKTKSFEDRLVKKGVSRARAMIEAATEINATAGESRRSATLSTAFQLLCKAVDAEQNDEGFSDAMNGVSGLVGWLTCILPLNLRVQAISTMAQQALLLSEDSAAAEGFERESVH